MENSRDPRSRLWLPRWRGSRSVLARAVVGAGVLCLVACGGGGSPAGGGGGGPDGGGGGGGGADGSGGGSGGALLPLAVGNSWTFQVTDSGTGAQGQKTQTVEAFEDVGGSLAGTMAYRLHTVKPGGAYTLSWQDDTGSTVIRLRDQEFAAGGAQKNETVFDPDKLRVDESPAHTASGAQFSLTYTEHTTDLTAGGAQTDVSKTEDWAVVAVDESLTTPAGTFSCLHLHRTDSATGSDKEYWFAAGVGKVKEGGLGQTEILTDYSVQ